MSEYQRIGIFGRSQSGKSSLMDRILRGHRRVVLFDAIDERAPTARAEGFSEITTISELQDRIDRDYASGFRLWFHPSYEADLVLSLSDVSRMLLDCQTQQAERGGTDKRPSIALAVDEMADCFPNQTLTREKDHFSIMCRSGRHKGIHLIGASQRPAEVSTKFRGQLSKRFIFNLTEPRDLQAVNEMGGADGKALAEAVRLQQSLEYIRLENGRYATGRINFQKK